MTNGDEVKRFAVDIDRIPSNFPTHRHDAVFWEALGRAVGTFGFLEEILGKAIFAFTATRQIPPDQIESEYAKWHPTLERALEDPLGLPEVQDEALIAWEVDVGSNLLEDGRGHARDHGLPRARGVLGDRRYVDRSSLTAWSIAGW